MAESYDDYESMSHHRDQTRNNFRNESNDDGRTSMMPLNVSVGGGSVDNSYEHSSPYYEQHHHSSSSYYGGSSSNINHGKNYLKRKERDYHPHSATAAAPYDGARNHRGPLYAEHPMPESDAMLDYHRGGPALDPYHMQTRQHPNSEPMNRRGEYPPGGGHPHPSGVYHQNTNMNTFGGSGGGRHNMPPAHSANSSGYPVPPFASPQMSRPDAGPSFYDQAPFAPHHHHHHHPQPQHQPPQHQHLHGGGGGGGGINMHKKLRKDWLPGCSPVAPLPAPSNYYEHDNRIAADYYDDELADEYHYDDYTSLSRPSNYSSYDSHPHPPPPSRHAGPNHPPTAATLPLQATQQLPFAVQAAMAQLANDPAALQIFMSSMMATASSQLLQQQQHQQQQYQPSFAAAATANANNINNINSAQTSSAVNVSANDDCQPHMLSFMQFVATLETNPDGSKSSSEQANLRYADYKLQFRCEQIADFFAAHKSEEWFRCRYHPEDSTRRKLEQRDAIKKRLDTFMGVLQAQGGVPTLEKSANGLSDDDEASNQARLVRFLDACLLRLEEDATAAVQEDERKSTSTKDAVKEEQQSQEKDKKVEEPAVEREEGEEREQPPTKEKPADDADAELMKANSVSATASTARHRDIHTPPPPAHKTQSIFFKHLPVIVTRQDLEKIGQKYEGFKRASISEPAPERRFQRRGWLTFDATVNIKDICFKIKGTRLCDMSLNAAINREPDQRIKYISGLANHGEIVRNDLKLVCRVVANMDKRWGLWQFDEPAYHHRLTKQTMEEQMSKELAAACDNNASTTAAAVDDEASATRGERANPFVAAALDYLASGAWLSSSSEQPQAETSSQADKPTEMAAAEVKREEGEAMDDSLSQASTTTAAITADTDNLSLLSKADDRATAAAGVRVKTPLLPLPPAAATSSSKPKPMSQLVTMERDPVACEHLDKLILYLRLVHSIDYYNMSEYHQEDWMPSRCGVLHARNSATSKNNSSTVSVINGIHVNYYDPDAIRRVQVDEWMRLFDAHAKPYTEYRERIAADMARRLGFKHLRLETDKFVADNCKQVDAAVWLCPLSGKKFKGPDYVRRHIETKHGDKLADLAKDVDYFNRFLLDPKRPYLPEHPQGKTGSHQHNNNNNNYNAPNGQFFQQQQLQQQQPTLSNLINNFIPPQMTHAMAASFNYINNNNNGNNGAVFLQHSYNNMYEQPPPGYTRNPAHPHHQQQHHHHQRGNYRNSRRF